MSCLERWAYSWIEKESESAVSVKTACNAEDQCTFPVRIPDGKSESKEWEQAA